MKVTAFIACFNHGRYVGEAIRSLYTQLDPPEECLLINDGSEDETAQVFEGAVREYGAKVIHHKKRQGHIASYNEGISLAKGDAIHLMSADDRLTGNTFYSQGRRALELAVLFSCGLRTMSVAGTLEEGIVLPPFLGIVSAERVLETLLKVGNFIVGAGTLVRAEIQKRHSYDARYSFTADLVNWARILGEGGKAAFSQTILFHYRRHPEQMTHVFRGSQEEREAAYGEIRESLSRLRQEFRYSPDCVL